MDLLHDTHVWFAFSFIVFIALAWKLGKTAVLNTLDGRIETIRQEIETAENLRVEAQELLAQYQRKQRDALKDAEHIIETARKSADAQLQQAHDELNETMKRREQQLEDRLARMEKSAIQEIRKHAASLAIEATAQIISNQLDQKANENLVDQAIKDIGKNIG